jgi:RimJ/RimL family protein N-acetyltransferase
MSATSTISFELQPTLRGELLELRPLRHDDFEALYSAASDPKIWEVHPESDRWKREVFERYFDSGIKSGGAFAIVERTTGKIIGSSRYHNFKPNESEMEVGYTFLERKFWGGKYNRELKKLMVDHAFRFVDRVVFSAGENNIRSRKALEKIGATYLRNENRPDRHGRNVTCVVYALNRPKSGK